MGCYVLHNYQLHAIQKKIGSVILEHFEQISSFRESAMSSFFTVEIPSESNESEEQNFIIGLVFSDLENESNKIAQTIKEFIKNSIFFQTKQYQELIDNVLLLFREPFLSTELFGSRIEAKDKNFKKVLTINLMMKIGNQIFVSRNLNIKDGIFQTNKNKWIVSCDGKKYIELKENKNLKPVSDTLFQVAEDQEKQSFFSLFFEGSNGKQIREIILTDELNATEFVCQDIRKQYPKRNISTTSSAMHCIKIHFDKRSNKQ